MTNHTQPLVIYHANCLDGFGAAYAVHLHFSARDIQGEYYPASHGDDPPDCTGRSVYLVDFSYKRPLLKKMCETAEKVVILDHHASAQRELDTLPDAYPNLEVHFDMDKSGAVLAWEYFHPDPPPALLYHVQDRDLWQFELADTRDITAALMSLPFEFDAWHALAQSTAALEGLKQEGRAINRFRNSLIERYRKRAFLTTIAGYEVPVVNCPGAIASELLGELAADYPFAAGYEDKAGERSWSLRSRGENATDVARIAELFGGGGHPCASGFATPLPRVSLDIEAITPR